MTARKQFSILTQPDDTTCGPTCLQAIYRYYGDRIGIDTVVKESDSLKGGGTLAVMLGLHALKRGYFARIFTYNLQVFDPSWFSGNVNLEKKLAEQAKYKTSKKLKTASAAYIEFLKRGGQIAFEDLTRSLLRKYLIDGTPILTGLSSTYLYSAVREIGDDCKEDDIKGEPTGHFVVLHSYNRETREISIADPYPHNPMSRKKNYAVHIDRVIGAILLGIVTYDANLLIIRPRTQ